MFEGLLPEFVNWSLAFLLVGIAIAGLDEYLGTKVYKWYHNLTNPDDNQMPEGSRKGFIVQCGWERKWAVASTLSFLQMFYQLFFSKDTGLTYEIVTLFVEVPLMVLGFYLSVPLTKWGRNFMKKVGPTLDSMESGETTLKDLANEAMGAADDKLSNVADQVSETVGKVTKEVKDYAKEKFKTTSSEEESVKTETPVGTEIEVEPEVKVETEIKPEVKSKPDPEPEKDPGDILKENNERII